MHILRDHELTAYRNDISRLLRPQTFYLLFARLNEGDDDPDGPRGLAESTIHSLFAEVFQLEWVNYGKRPSRINHPGPQPGSSSVV